MTPRGRVHPVEATLGAYALATAVLVAVRAPWVPGAPWLLAAHAGLLALLAAMPPRGARWERGPSGERGVRRALRRAARFLRHAYPLVAVALFFEEVRFTIHAVWPGDPYWFEPWLYRADEVLFGGLPAERLAPWVTPWLTEAMHALYFAYYPLLVTGVAVAYRGAGGRPAPGPGVDAAVAGMSLAFVLAFVLYPWLPARGPWENAELVARLPRFEGWVFTAIVQWIIERAAVSGGCFPSAHVAGSWGLVLSLAPAHPAAARRLGLVAAGMSLACVYTRYHHGVDVVAGVLVGAAGAALGRSWAGPRAPRHAGSG